MTDSPLENQCRWNPDDPRLCFEADDCGCFMDPCEYFDLPPEQCTPEEEEWVYVELHPIASETPDDGDPDI